MSVSGMGHLSALDAILYDRPAGRNIIDYAREEIERLRGQLEAQATMIAECEDERYRLRGALETILTVPAGDGAAASMSKIALKALRIREALGGGSE